jgi:hypothetical protein
MRLEAWPGGRWYRDLGNGAGHLGQRAGNQHYSRSADLMFMSYPAVSNVQYRLTESTGLHG